MKHDLLLCATMKEFNENMDVTPTLKSMVSLFIGSGVGEMFDIELIRIDVTNDCDGSKVWQEVSVYDYGVEEIVLELRELIAC